MVSTTPGNTRTLAGRCMCGAIHYVVVDAFRYAANCYCSHCRRATGSAFKPFAGIERDKMAVTEGGDRLLIFGDEIARLMRAAGRAARSSIRSSATARSFI
jgi:hypothetical protein